jgi:hypothetical protein
LAAEKRFAVLGRREDYSGVNLSHINEEEIENGKSSKLSGKGFRAPSSTIEGKGLSNSTTSLKQPKPHIVADEFLIWWPGAWHLRGRVPKIYLPGTGFNVQSASTQLRKEDSITSGESPPAKGASDGSKVNPESEPLKSESKRESSLTNRGT